jgi:hypothetical protein
MGGDALSPAVLAGAAAIWKSQRRVLTARFGGTSMLPTLPPGVELRFECGAPVAVGDIAVLLHRGQVLVHRVVGRGTSPTLLTRGDGTWVPDPPMSEGDVVGRVVEMSSGGSWGPPGAAPGSGWRRLVLAACLGAVKANERGGAALIALLWQARFGLQLVPRALARRLRGGRGGGASQPEGQQAGAREPERH